MLFNTREPIERGIRPVGLYSASCTLRTESSKPPRIFHLFGASAITTPETKTIPLDKFLKYVGAVGTGGEAKFLIQDGAVRVNDEVETRRGRKLAAGDTVELNDETFVVAFDEEEA